MCWIHLKFQESNGSQHFSIMHLTNEDLTEYDQDKDKFIPETFIEHRLCDWETELGMA